MDKSIYSGFLSSTRIDNIRNNLEVELNPFEPQDASPITGNFSIHEHVKHGQVEELYKHVAQLLTFGYQAVDKAASLLDFEGFAALHYAALQPSVVAARLLLDNGVFLDVESRKTETPLHLALRHGNIPMATLFMDRGASLKKTDRHGNNALHLAIERGLRGMAVKILMRCPFLVYSQTHFDFTALHYAAMQGDAQLCEKLLSCEAKVTAKNSNGETPLHLVSLLNHVDAMKVLLMSGCPNNECRSKFLDIPRKDHFTALHIAAKMGHIETVKLIMDSGVKVNQSNGAVPNALEMAAGDGHVEVMKLFLDGGAAIDAKDRYGNTALHKAAMNGRVEAVRLLLANGANIESVNEDGWTPLFFSVSRCHHEVTKILLENGADCNCVDTKLCCCLHYAVKENDCKIIPHLLRHGGNGLIFRRNINDQLIIHEAVLSGNEKVLEMLLNRCSGTIIYCDNKKTLIHMAAELNKLACLKKLTDIWPIDYVNMTDNNKQTALHLAAKEGHLYVCRHLIKSKADVNIVDKDGMKPLHVAVVNDNNTIVQLLIEAKTELVTADLEPAIKSGNVEALTMILDSLAINHIGTANIKFDALEQALNGDSEGVVEAIVDHYSFQDAVKNDNLLLDHLMPVMIAKYPEVVIKILNKGISVSEHQYNCKEFEVSYDFSALQASPCSCRNTFASGLYFGPAIMADLDREECLAHPLTQKLINVMWSSAGGIVYYFSFFIYLTFIISLTALIILEREADLKLLSPLNTTNGSATPAPSGVHVPSKSSSGQVLAYFIFIFLCITFVKECVQIFALGFRYCKELSNILEWKVLISAFGYLNGFLFMNYSSKEVELLLGVCSLFFGWLNVLLFLRRSPMFNIYVVMFTQVIYTLIRVLFVFTPLLLAFSLAFNQLFLTQTVFKDMRNSYMKTFVMLSGELEYEDTIPNAVGTKDSKSAMSNVPLPLVSYLIYSMFIIMLPVALMNLLVGLAVGDIESIRKSAKHNVMKQQARYMKDLIDKSPKFIVKCTYKRFLVERPNEKSWLKRFFSSKDAGEDLTAFIEGRIKNQEDQKSREQEKKLGDLQTTVNAQNCVLNRINTKLADHGRMLKEALS